MARQALGERRVGHTGTLDPMAEGLFLLCVGRATRLQQFLLKWDKTYQGEIRLGHATTTYDARATAWPRGATAGARRRRNHRLDSEFCGEIDQCPPPTRQKRSAAGRCTSSPAPASRSPPTKNRHGSTAHLIRAEAADVLLLEVTASSGFYVRSLAHDIGIELGCGGHLSAWTARPSVLTPPHEAMAQSALEAASSPEAVIDGPHWVPLEKIPLPFTEIDINSAAAERFVHGQEIVVFSAGG